MFRANKKHKQIGFFGIQNSLPVRLQSKLSASWQHFFYETIFCSINEEDFAALYSDKASRPNAPINCLVASIILKQKCNWSYDELIEEIEYNILTKTALGLDTLDDIPFNESTLFNFQFKMMEYEVKTGISLMAQVFDKLTKAQVKKLKLKTDIQRSDSLQASSNIRSYSRLQLLIEVLLRLWRLMDDSEKLKYESTFSVYTKKTSGQYVYKLKSTDLPHEIEKIAELFRFCKMEIMPRFETNDFYEVFDRVYTEHFTEVAGKIEVKPASELKSSNLQSPDDLDATFREKRKEQFRGQLINVTETASQDNPINLIIDVAVTANNIDDSQVLNQRIDTILEKTPDLKELHTDGAYGSADNDLKFEENGIIHIQTAVRGQQCEVDIEITHISDEQYLVKCPLQSAESQLARKRQKALFDKAICQDCPLSGKCPMTEGKTNRTYYFTHEDFLRNMRIRSILKIPPGRRCIRSNVEATVHEFSCRLTNGKLKYRGRFKAELFANSVAIAINFGRIFRFKTSKRGKFAFFVGFLVNIIKERIEILKNKIIKKIFFKVRSNVRIAQGGYGY